MSTKLQLRVRDILGSDHLLSSVSACELICNFNNATAIELDFSGVNEMGDDFAREIFIVWRGENPESTIAVIKASECVEKIIERVMKSR